jgi:cell division septation protein DedD
MIEKYIPKLIEEQNEVILPSFGAFVATLAPSEIVGKNIVPPHLKVVFFPKITSDKAHVLKKTVILNEKISESDYDDFYFAFLEQIQEAVSEKGFYKFQGLGILHKKYNGDWEFEADNAAGLFSQAFGLPVLHKTPVKPLQTVSAEAERPDNTDAHTDEVHAENNAGEKAGAQHAHTEEKRTNPAMWLILIPVMAVGALMFYLFSNNTPDKIILKDEKAAQTTDSTKTGQKTDLNPDENKVAQSNSQTVKEGNSESKPADTKENKTETKPAENTAATSSEKFYVIVGSVKTEAQAKQFLQKLKNQGFNAPEYMLNEANGQYRVAAAAAVDKTESDDKKKAVVKFYKDAWILKK